ncbi:hypothetical protein BC628DRAFT_1391085 [Trametes gibbosa]|nr:hypothetical protein BC628DRAFT_1391085 [Trametes gibbosa]
MLSIVYREGRIVARTRYHSGSKYMRYHQSSAHLSVARLQRGGRVFVDEADYSMLYVSLSDRTINNKSSNILVPSSQTPTSRLREGLDTHALRVQYNLLLPLPLNLVVITFHGTAPLRDPDADILPTGIDKQTTHIISTCGSHNSGRAIDRFAYHDI